MFGLAPTFLLPAIASAAKIPNETKKEAFGDITVEGKRHATTPEELEGILLEGILSGEPVKDEITAVTQRPCAKHPELINPMMTPR